METEQGGTRRTDPSGSRDSAVSNYMVSHRDDVHMKFLLTRVTLKGELSTGADKC